MAVLASLANSSPQTIENMISDNRNGTYTVKFEGIKRYLFVTARQTVNLQFVRGRHANVGPRRALWPLVVEKAYAKEKGGLDELDKGGNPGEAARDLTGEAPDGFNPADKSSRFILNKLDQGKRRRAIMTVLAPKRDDATEEKKGMADDIPGLYFWHTYSIVDVDKNGSRVKLINPWGRDHPNGDGWLSVRDFKRFFIEVDING